MTGRNYLLIFFPVRYIFTILQLTTAAALAMAFCWWRHINAQSKIMKNQRESIEGIEAATFHAIKRPFQNRDGHRWAGRHEIVRTDTMETLGICGHNYNVVQHSDVIDTAMAAFGRLNIDEKDVTPTVKTFDNGAEMFARFDFKNGKQRRQVQKGESIGFRLEFGNSLNGRKRTTARGGSLDLVCSNGMVQMVNAKTAFSLKHTGAWSITDYVESFEALFANFEKEIEAVKGLQKIEFAHVKGLNMVGHLIRDYLKTNNEDSRTLVGYFNDPDSALVERYRNRGLHGSADASNRNAWHVYSAATALLRDRERAGRFDDAQNKRQSLAALFGRIAEEPSRIEPMLNPHPKFDLEELAAN